MSIGGAGRLAGLEIHRNVDPKRWRQAVDALPDDIREEAEQYLAGVVACYRALRKIAIDAGCSSMEEFSALRVAARKAGAPSATAYDRAGRPDKWFRSRKDFIEEKA